MLPVPKMCEYLWREQACSLSSPSAILLFIYLSATKTSSEVKGFANDPTSASNKI